MQNSSIRKPLGTAIMLVLAGGSASTAAGQNTTFSSVAMDAAGNSVVAWEDRSGADSDLGGIFAQRYDSAGLASSAAAMQVNTTTPGDQRAPVTAMAADGSFVVVWQGPDQGGDSGIFAQRYNADGTMAGGEFRVNDLSSGVQQHPAVAMGPAGDFVVAWEDGFGDGSGLGIMAKRYLADGRALGQAFAVNTATAGDQRNPAVAVATSGAFTLSWEDANAAIRMQRYAADGSALGAEQQVTPLAPVVAGAARLAIDGIARAAASGVDLKLTMSSSASGNTLSYTLNVQNNGTVSASAVQIIDTLPGGVGFLSASGTNWNCSRAPGTVTCDLASLAVGASSSVTVNVDTTGVNSSSLTNSAEVSSNVADDNLADNTASVVNTVTSSSGSAGGAGAFGWFTLLLGLFGLRRRWR